MRVLRIVSALLLFALAASAGTYTVRWGETLGGIAKRHGVGVDALAAANGIRDVNRIRQGQVLTLPGAPLRLAPPPAAPPAAPVGGPVPLHRVAAGETLGTIAQKRGIPLATLMSVNGISDPNKVQAGQLLRVSGPPRQVCPVAAPVKFVSGFGEARGSRRHQGVDLVAPRGTPVVANVSGVLEQHPNGLGGNAYYLRGDDGDVYYGAHLDRFVGGSGRVQIGQLIGTVGNTGNAVGGVTHLHFERMPRGGAPVDPFAMLDRACFKA